MITEAFIDAFISYVFPLANMLIQWYDYYANLFVFWIIIKELIQLPNDNHAPIRSVEIDNFGPLKHVRLNLAFPLQLFIGPQASGKSTLGKVIYFCRRIRDYLCEYARDIWNNPKQADLYGGFLKSLKNPFMGCFGTTKHMESFTIHYVYSRNTEKSVTITLGNDNFVKFVFSPSLRNPLNALLESAKKVSINLSGDFFQDTMAQQTYLAQFKQEACRLFEDEASLLYIPAGRNLLATIPDRILDSNASAKNILEQADISEIDLCTQSFIRYIKRMRGRFGSRLEEIKTNYVKTVSGAIQYRDVDLACELIHNVLKADYVYDKDGEKLFYEEGRWTKLMFGSSGQQEVLWALNCLFLAILQRDKTFFVFEEPESHIFPDSQLIIMELVALLINSTGSEVFLTTHSPYILTATNLLLYSGQIERSNNQSIVNPRFRLRSNLVDAYLIRSGAHELQHLIPTGQPLIDAVEIDRISEVINQKMDQILDLEVLSGGAGQS